METIPIELSINSRWVNRKTGRVYRVIDLAVDVTNERDGTAMVIYRADVAGSEASARFVRERVEFLAKFTPGPTEGQGNEGPDLHTQLASLRAERDALAAKLNAPELLDFVAGTVSEAAHQRERWGSEHDAGKAPADWFWLLGFLSGKALHAHATGNPEKALHHTISSAAALANWHAAILGNSTMRPGLGADAVPEGLGLPDPPFYDLVALRAAAADACARASANRSNIADPVNWAHLLCVSAERCESDSGHVGYRVVISKASPDATALQAAIAATLETKGFLAIDVHTEW